MGERTAYIGLGSNLGNRVEALSLAIEKIKTLTNSRLKTVSCLYETSPVDVDGGRFINAVVEIETRLTPLRLLEELLNLETAMGRKRKQGNNGSRLIDLDLLLYGTVVIEEKGLSLPHPRILHRRFVMEPLAELAPDLKIPPSWITTSKAAANLSRNHPEQEVKRLGTLEEVKENYGLRIEN